MKGIIFDFNGTLFWDSQLHYDAWRDFSRQLRGYEFTDAEMREKMFGHTNSDIIEYAIGKKPTQEMVNSLGKAKESLYRKQCIKNPACLTLAPGAEKFLDFLKENEIPMAIATMSEWDNVEFYIKVFNLTKWFDMENIIYSNGKIPGKPAPDIFEIAAKSLNLPTKDCIVIEDAIAGIKAANSAKIGKVVAITSLEPIGYYQKIEGIDYIIKNFDEFDLNLFNKICKEKT